MAPSRPTRPTSGRTVGSLTMRAVAHPLRLALLENLAREGPLTATEASGIVNESPAACSFHLRQLAKYGLIEDAGESRRRQRPWRLTDLGQQCIDLQQSSDIELAAGLLDQVHVGRYLDRHQAWLRARSSLPREWREAAGHSEVLLYVTPQELRALDAEVTAVLRRVADRVAKPPLRPRGSLPIQVLFFAFPVVPTRDG